MFVIRPPVALESSVFAHGLPTPVNVETAREMEMAVHEGGATARITGFLAGEPVAGLDQRAVSRFGSEPAIAKAGLADLPVVLARGLDAATTVATASWIAHRLGIKVVTTGGIGGVHMGIHGASSPDVSGDLEALATLPVTVICSGPKAVLDLVATRERLESAGVTVVGYRTDTMPAFWFADSGLAVDVRCDSPAEVATIVRARDGLGTGRAILVCVPVPDEAAVLPAEVSGDVEEAIRAADAAGLQAGFVTPFLLSKVSDAAGGALLRANVALLRNNAYTAALVACALLESDHSQVGTTG